MLTTADSTETFSPSDTVNVWRTGIPKWSLVPLFSGWSIHPSVMTPLSLYDVASSPMQPVIIEEIKTKEVNINPIRMTLLKVLNTSIDCQISKGGPLRMPPFAWVPTAQLNRPSFHDVMIPVKADAATVSGLAR